MRYIHQQATEGCMTAAVYMLQGLSNAVVHTGSVDNKHLDAIRTCSCSTHSPCVQQQLIGRCYGYHTNSPRLRLCMLTGGITLRPIPAHGLLRLLGWHSVTPPAPQAFCTAQHVTHPGVARYNNLTLKPSPLRWHDMLPCLTCLCCCQMPCAA